MIIWIWVQIPFSLLSKIDMMSYNKLKSLGIWVVIYIWLEITRKPWIARVIWWSCSVVYTVLGGNWEVFAMMEEGQSLTSSAGSGTSSASGLNGGSGEPSAVSGSAGGETSAVSGSAGGETSAASGSAGTIEGSAMDESEPVNSDDSTDLESSDRSSPAGSTRDADESSGPSGPPSDSGDTGAEQLILPESFEDSDLSSVSSNPASHGSLSTDPSIEKMDEGAVGTKRRLGNEDVKGNKRSNFPDISSLREALPEMGGARAQEGEGSITSVRRPGITQEQVATLPNPSRQSMAADHMKRYDESQQASWWSPFNSDDLTTDTAPSEDSDS